tara:strand:+ start:435 stop:884 length:450 start_codon:yes stop_codon:yes gene_type:complete
MKKTIFILLIFCSCGFMDEQNIVPDNLISEEKMVDILYDMSLISVSKGINKMILENNGMKPKKYILKKYNIDSLQFVLSNDFYSKDLKKYLMIYEDVLKKLENNRDVILDSIENYKKNRAKRSKEIINSEASNLAKKGLDTLNSKVTRN